MSRETRIWRPPQRRHSDLHGASGTAAVVGHDTKPPPHLATPRAAVPRRAKSCSSERSLHTDDPLRGPGDDRHAKRQGPLGGSHQLEDTGAALALEDQNGTTVPGLEQMAQVRCECIGPDVAVIPGWTAHQAVQHAEHGKKRHEPDPPGHRQINAGSVNGVPRFLLPMPAAAAAVRPGPAGREPTAAPASVGGNDAAYG